MDKIIKCIGPIECVIVIHEVMLGLSSKIRSNCERCCTKTQSVSAFKILWMYVVLPFVSNHPFSESTH